MKGQIAALCTAKQQPQMKGHQTGVPLITIFCKRGGQA